MTTQLTIRKVRPWKGKRGPIGDATQRAPLEDLIPPVTPGRKYSSYSSGAPDWRWQESDKIFQSISSPSDYDPGRDIDPLIINNIVPFLFHYKTITSLKGEMAVRGKFPDIFWAQRIHQEEDILGCFFQAAALAGAPLEEIADRMCVLPEQIWWYEKIFFDVRACLHKPEWIIMNVFYPALQRFGRLHTPDFLWKALAWNKSLGWEHFLNIVNPMESLTSEARGRVIDMLDRKILEDTLLAVFSRIPNRFNENFIVEQYLKILEIERETGQSHGERQKDNNLLILMKTIQNSFHMASVENDFKGVEARAHSDLVNIYQERAKLAADTERTKLGEIQ